MDASLPMSLFCLLILPLCLSAQGSAQGNLLMVCMQQMTAFQLQNQSNNLLQLCSVFLHASLDAQCPMHDTATFF